MDEELGETFQTAFWGAKRAMRDASEAAFGRYGVRGGQEFILRCLWERDGQTPGEVARRWELATPTVTRTAIRMEATGLLTRTPDPTDGRLIRLYLTERGRSLRDALQTEMRRLSERTLRGMSPTEQELLVHLLTQIRRNLTDTPADTHEAQLPRGTR